MNPTEKKHWRNAIPLNRWMHLHTSNNETQLVFKLRHYEIINGAPKWEIEEQNGIVHEASVGEMRVSKDLSVRLFLPIELIKMKGHTISAPKLVFSMDKDCMISHFDPATEQAIFTDAARQHTPRKVTL